MSWGDVDPPCVFVERVTGLADIGCDYFAVIGQAMRENWKVAPMPLPPSSSARGIVWAWNTQDDQFGWQECNEASGEIEVRP